jgi:hypothetical protein
VMMLCLGTAVWEGFPGAATRVLLPLNLAFNLLAHRVRAGLGWLLAGNLTVFAGLDPAIHEAVRQRQAYVRFSFGSTHHGCHPGMTLSVLRHLSASDSIFKQPSNIARVLCGAGYAVTLAPLAGPFPRFRGGMLFPLDRSRGWSTERRTSPSVAAFPRENAGASRRSIAVRVFGFRPKTQAPGPRFLGRGNGPVPVQRSSFAEGS